MAWLPRNINEWTSFQSSIVAAVVYIVLMAILIVLKAFPGIIRFALLSTPMLLAFFAANTLVERRRKGKSRDT